MKHHTNLFCCSEFEHFELIIGSDVHSSARFAAFATQKNALLWRLLAAGAEVPNMNHCCVAETRKSCSWAAFCQSDATNLSQSPNHERSATHRNRCNLATWPSFSCQQNVIWGTLQPALPIQRNKVCS
jgi:hypothetical protein